MTGANKNGWLLRLVVGLSLAAFMAAMAASATWLGTATVSQGKAIARIETTVDTLAEQIDTLNRWVIGEDSTLATGRGRGGR